LVAVDLDDEPRFLAEEIDDESSQWFLPSPLHACIVAEIPPQPELFIGHRLAQPAGEGL